ADCVDGDPSCDSHRLTVAATAGNSALTIEVTPGTPADDYDVFLYDANGIQVGSSTNSAGTVEKITLESPAAGVYTVKVLAFLVAPGSTYSATARLAGSTSTAPPPTPGSVLWNWDRTAPQASVEVPLRVVLVGFKPGELDTNALIGEVPDTQRPGVLTPRGGAGTGGDAFPLFGAETLVNHGRNYYESSKPFTVPYEYKWKRSVIYASDAFADALFKAMADNSSAGDYSSSRNRQFLESYNTTRGGFRGADKLVLPNEPVRFVDGEKTEDWLAANAKAFLGFDHAGVGKGPGANPGYTVYVLNTWDSPAAERHLKPRHAYHVWRVQRNDPDTGAFDGIDWARIWGGRYRFMMLD